MWKEAIMAQFDLMSWHMDLGSEENKNISLI